ncbi:MAG: acetylglutamate kinase [Elusimicrobiota bacterium]|jgi:acetylglutamate kinase|nr:acetylglutamate kinase [Elusimicrobiota bacterium]
MFDSKQKIETLIEAMPYIRRFQNKIIVIKYGGHAMVNPDLKQKFAQDIAFLQFSGLRPVVVHGGGPEITQMLSRLGKKSEFIEGLRVTDAEAMEIAQMVLVGKINTDITSAMVRYGAKALGINGKDSNLLMACKLLKKIKKDDKIKEIDLGFVGDVKSINGEFLRTILDSGYIPVIAPLGSDENGQSYNINADTVAGKIAATLQAEKLIMLTDVKGIFENPKDPKSFISELSFDKAYEMILRGAIDGGMIPKINACILALKNQTKAAHIIDGTIPRSILMEIFTDKGFGTMVVK